MRNGKWERNRKKIPMHSTATPATTKATSAVLDRRRSSAYTTIIQPASRNKMPASFMSCLTTGVKSATEMRAIARISFPATAYQRLSVWAAPKCVQSIFLMRVRSRSKLKRTGHFVMAGTNSERLRERGISVCWAVLSGARSPTTCVLSGAFWYAASIRLEDFL